MGVGDTTAGCTYLDRYNTVPVCGDVDSLVSGVGIKPEKKISFAVHEV